jgi:hypothetical protein
MSKIIAAANQATPMAAIVSMTFVSFYVPPNGGGIGLFPPSRSRQLLNNWRVLTPTIAG